ncbi:zinc-binding dehydrogenase [Allosaccharopolyspora coralli]|uniref:Zinc-binding dehydrogenase n=1 Tax=Allosaccharopolyspora coralli TaxID=2665642 RepID=A0A5Q3QHP1_9PSEU|nr:Zn-dependent alcohol dehydrogenase [Allosaccharopolyspora coralli]QGK70357.1 zinc-binding dehydrogenase [Allosaccharopolyspora coralli]
MKAAVLNEIGDRELQLRADVTTAELAPDQVRVRTRVAGICHSDLAAMDGSLPAMAPGVIGHEGSGDVVEVGEQVADLAPGDRVVVSFVAPCGHCKACASNQAYLCDVHVIEGLSTPRFSVGGEPTFGFAGLGTFAEELVVPRAGVVKIEDDVPYEVAALVGCAVVTGVGAVINTAAVRPGSSVAVLGCGGVGISAIQGARAVGATTIVAVDPVVGKHELAERFGATHATTPDGLADVSQDVTGGAGFDYVFEVVGRGSTIRAAYDATRRGGTTVVVGAGSPEEKVEFSAQELFMMERKILPSFYGSVDPRRDVDLVLSLWRTGRLDLEGMVSKRIGLADVNAGLEALHSPDGGLVRQVITFD